MTGRGAVRIGTSGWHYLHWVGPFYPAGLRPAQFLAHCSERFGSVEINNSFYQLPSAADLRRWKNTVPEGFVFVSVRATHLYSFAKG